MTELEIASGTRLAGKAALITGAANGIGGATARLFAAQGAAVALTDLDEDRLAETLTDAKEYGGGAIALQHDVSSEQDWQRVVSATIEEFGRIDVLVNIAGIHPFTQLDDITLADWNRIIEIDLTGPFLGTQAVVPHMLAQGSGSIVNVASVSAFVAGPFAHYNAAKAGVRSLTRSTAIVHAADNIRANCVCPGLIETNMTKAGLADPVRRARLENAVPMPHFGKPIDIAYGIVYLASDEARFMTGSDLVIDGGRMLK